MSQHPVYCYCDDGCWYKDPIWTNFATYYVCEDDDDPTELVVRFGHEIPELAWFKCGVHWTKGMTRNFPIDLNKWKLWKAKSCFGRMVDNPPPPQIFGAKYDERPDRVGVFLQVKG